MSSHDKAIMFNTIIALGSISFSILVITLGSMRYYGKRAIEKHQQDMKRLEINERQIELQQLAAEERLLDKKLALGRKQETNI